MVRNSPYCNRSSCHVRCDVVSDHWSNGSDTRDLRRVFQVREALLSRINPTLWHTLLHLLLLAPRRWLLPGTTNGTWLEILQLILLPFLMRCGFWPLIHWYVYPWSSQSFPKERTAGVSSRSITLTNKSTCLTQTGASSLASSSPLAVTTVVGLLETLTVSKSAELRSFLLTICMLAPESTTDALSSGFIVDVAGKIHSSVGEQNAVFLFFELIESRAHRSCLSVSSWDLSSNFTA